MYEGVCDILFIAGRHGHLFQDTQCHALYSTFINKNLHSASTGSPREAFVQRGSELMKGELYYQAGSTIMCTTNLPSGPKIK